jgi:hypothetical protein
MKNCKNRGASTRALFTSSCTRSIPDRPPPAYREDWTKRESLPRLPGPVAGGGTSGRRTGRAGRPPPPGTRWPPPRRAGTGRPGWRSASCAARRRRPSANAGPEQLLAPENWADTRRLLIPAGVGGRGLRGAGRRARSGAVGRGSLAAGGRQGLRAGDGRLGPGGVCRGPGSRLGGRKEMAGEGEIGHGSSLLAGLCPPAGGANPRTYFLS